MSTLNLYGDATLRIDGTQGTDISAQRMDDLDKMALMAALEHSGHEGWRV